MSKGSKTRVSDRIRFRDNYDNIQWKQSADIETVSDETRDNEVDFVRPNCHSIELEDVNANP